MRPRELIAGRPATLDSIDGALNGGFIVEPFDSWESDHVLLDTFDRLLRAEGLVLSHEHGRLSLTDRAMLVGVEAQPLPDAPTAPVLGLDLPSGRLRDMVLEVIGVRALLPLVRLHVRTDAYRILDELRKTVVRVNVLVPALLSSRGSAAALSTRVRLHEVRGYAEERDRVAGALEPALALTETGQTLADEALRSAGERADGISTKIEVPLMAQEPAAVAVGRVLRALLEVIDANLPGTIADIDSEFLHDYRVSIRRTRAVQREFKHVFEPEALAHARAEFKWLQQVTGDSRDLDVYVLGFEKMRSLLPEAMRADLQPLLIVLRRRRAVAHGVMVRALRSDRAREARSDWVAVLDVLDHGPDADRPNTAGPIGELASKRIRKVYKKMVRMGKALDPESPPESFHELRKKGKELRYLLELFGAHLHDPAVVKPMIKTLKSLQDVLGHHQDREVQMVMLRSLADEVGSLPGGPRALMAMGVLIERLEEDAAATRRDFAEVFAEFAAKPQRTLVKDTFA